MKIDFSKKEIAILQDGETLAKAIKLVFQPEPTEQVEHTGRGNRWQYLDESGVWKRLRLPWVIGGTVKVYGTDLRPIIKNIVMEKREELWYANLILEPRK